MDQQLIDFLAKHPGEYEVPSKEEIDDVTRTLNENGMEMRDLIVHSLDIPDEWEWDDDDDDDDYDDYSDDEEDMVILKKECIL